MPYPYLHDLVQRVDDIDVSTWKAVCDSSGNPFLDLRFLRAVETSFAGEAQFWYATFRNHAGRPIACTCFSRYLVDGALMAPPAFQQLVTRVRRIWPSFFTYRILLCGLPVSTCGNQLAAVPEVDFERLTGSLDALASDLARGSGSGLVSFKEFDRSMTARLSGLRRHQYLRAKSVVAYSLEGEFGDFENYQASRSKRTRANIRRHFRKSEDAGLRFEHLRGRDGVDRLFDNDVHQLYLNVLDRAEIRFERIPAEFFRELARRLPDESCFTIARKADRIVGFCCAVASRQAYNMLFCGLDYSLNAEADLYFNLIYRGLSQGLAPGVRVVHIGASADEFKQHMGCRGEALSVYVKAIGTVRQFLLRQVFGLLFDTTDASDTVSVPESTQLVPAAESYADAQSRPAA